MSFDQNEDKEAISEIETNFVGKSKQIWRCRIGMLLRACTLQSSAAAVAGKREDLAYA